MTEKPPEEHEGDAESPTINQALDIARRLTQSGELFERVLVSPNGADLIVDNVRFAAALFGQDAASNARQGAGRILYNGEVNRLTCVVPDEQVAEELDCLARLQVNLGPIGPDGYPKDSKQEVYIIGHDHQIRRMSGQSMVLGQKYDIVPDTDLLPITEQRQSIERIPLR